MLHSTDQNRNITANQEGQQTPGVHPRKRQDATGELVSPLDPWTAPVGVSATTCRKTKSAPGQTVSRGSAGARACVRRKSHFLAPAVGPSRSRLCCDWPYAGAGSPASARPSGRELSQRLLGGCVRKPAGGGGPALRVRPENWEEAGEKMPSESFCLAAQARLDSRWLKTDIQMIVSNKVEQRKKIWMSDREKKDEEETPAPVYSAKSILDSWVWGKQPDVNELKEYLSVLVKEQ
ncbi:uncharacterized protein LOC115835564 [Nomascus leucogenys]|uniref:uncharacterized protein LOC115835564 n=1 Tax=Nomascus leucogenys TaxID=61853 RepID=UPI00122D82A0|nr:uncharacterized protein LOC115835564 [Nomascus leucogenys]